MPAKKKQTEPMPNVVIPPAPEGEESTEQQALDLAEKAVGMLEEAMDSKRRKTEEEKAEILAWAEAQGRGGLKRASEKFGISYVTLNAWKAKAKGGTKEDGSPMAPKPRKLETWQQEEIVEMDKVYSVLAGKGFDISIVQRFTPDGMTSQLKSDPKLEKLNFTQSHPSAIHILEDKKTHVVSTKNKVVVAMTLDTLLAVCGIKP
jgi:hypothetical protein